MHVLHSLAAVMAQIATAYVWTAVAVVGGIATLAPVVRPRGHGGQTRRALGFTDLPKNQRGRIDALADAIQACRTGWMARRRIRELLWPLAIDAVRLHSGATREEAARFVGGAAWTQVSSAADLVSYANRWGSDPRGRDRHPARSYNDFLAGLTSFVDEVTRIQDEPLDPEAKHAE